MKYIFSILLAILVVIGVAADVSAKSKGKSAAERTDSKDGKPVTTGDDLFPWPWGSECPFPWQEIEGSWTVKSLGKASAYNNTFLSFGVDQEDGNVKFLRVAHFDRRGYLMGEGKGFSEKDKRVVRAMLTNVETGKNYVLMVRTYLREKSSRRCGDDNMVAAVTFCPVRGKKCLETENYVLSK